MKKILIVLLVAVQTIAFGQSTKLTKTPATEPYLLPPFPEVPAKQPIDSVTMGDWKSFPEMKLDIPIAPGPFEPTWESIEKNYPGEPA